VSTRFIPLLALLLGWLSALCPSSAVCQKQRDYLQVVKQASPSVSLASSAGSVPSGKSVTFTAQLTGTASPPTGTVAFMDGTGELGRSTLNGDGTTTYATSGLPAGQNSMTAFYGGDTNYAPAISSQIVVTVAGPGPVVTATPSATTIIGQQGVTVAVSVTAGNGQAAPTGTVTLAGGSYSAQQPLTNGTASFAIPPGTLSVGVNALTATYSGDGTYGIANGTTSVTVSPFAIAISNPSPVSPGANAMVVVTLLTNPAYVGTINLTCALTNSPAGAQSLPTCIMTPSSVAIMAGGSKTSVLTVYTTAASTSAHVRPFRQQLWGIGPEGAVLAVVLFFGLPPRRRRWISMLVLGVIAVSGAIGCVSGGGSSAAPPSSSPSTPATTVGSYTFTVTGTDTVSATMTSSTNVVITVQ